jgi:hypothetical protein
MTIVFAGVASAALVAGAGAKPGAVEALWWMGVALTAFTLIAFLAVFFSEPGHLK